MKLATFIITSMLFVASAKTSAAKPEKLEEIKKYNPIQSECIIPYQEQHSSLIAEKKSEFDLIKASYRSGEISEADLGFQLQETALSIEAELASLEAKKEICEVQYEEIEEMKEEIISE